ncbi:hypothetical protein [Rhizobium sp. Root483D2]|uniref:hypothetical protein n=1 Tax=Rhizobium sp. Root483D2 TaxID=1736545 RepID=UPI0007159057|nr:hypothetical protein [Rhizobium sp. Root483D2]KQY31805.1 hypothetical protein ASD32_04220 [Rhizobium sp. Root483D2]
MKLAALSFIAVSAFATQAYAEDKSVSYAYALCQIVDNTGLASAPCDVSGWNSSVTATIDMNSGEARDLCGKVANMLHEQGAVFSKGWTFQIKSPYSGENAIAFCNL